MTVPIFYRGGGDAELVNYQFTDEAAGKTYIRLYAGDYYNAQEILGTAQFYGDKGITVPGGNTAIDVDFDMVCERSILVDGRVFVNVPILRAKGTGSGDITTTVTALLRKWDGTTETEIASGSSLKSGTVSADTAVRNNMCGISFDVDKKLWKKGQTMRLTIWTTAAGANTEVCLGHDPKGRTTTESTSAFGNGIAWTGSGDTNVSILSMDIPVKPRT